MCWVDATVLHNLEKGMEEYGELNTEKKMKIAGTLLQANGTFSMYFKVLWCSPICSYLK